MSKIKEKVISNSEINELRNLAFHNKSNVMYKKVRFSVDGIEYELLIRGIGRKTVKFELYLDYERILELKDSGIIEHKIWDKLNTVYHKEQKQKFGN